MICPGPIETALNCPSGQHRLEQTQKAEVFIDIGTMGKAQLTSLEAFKGITDGASDAHHHVYADTMQRPKCLGATVACQYNTDASFLQRPGSLDPRMASKTLARVCQRFARGKVAVCYE